MVFYIVKKKSLHFHLLSNFPTFVQKSGCSLKKKKRSSLPFALKFPTFVQKSGCSLKKRCCHFFATRNKCKITFVKIIYVNISK